MQVISGCCILQTSFFSAETSIHIDWHDWQSSNPMHPNSCQLVSVSWSSCQHPAAHSWQANSLGEFQLRSFFRPVSQVEASWRTIAEIKLSSFCWFCQGKIGKKTWSLSEVIRSWSYDIFWCLILFNTNPYSPMCFCAHLIHWKLSFFTSPLPKSLIFVGLMTLVGPRQFGGWIPEGLQVLQFAESLAKKCWAVD